MKYDLIARALGVKQIRILLKFFSSEGRSEHSPFDLLLGIRANQRGTLQNRGCGMSAPA